MVRRSTDLLLIYACVTAKRSRQMCGRQSWKHGRPNKKCYLIISLVSMKTAIYASVISNPGICTLPTGDTRMCAATACSTMVPTVPGAQTIISTTTSVALHQRVWKFCHEELPGVRPNGRLPRCHLRVSASRRPVWSQCAQGIARRAKNYTGG